MAFSNYSAGFWNSTMSAIRRRLFPRSKPREPQEVLGLKPDHQDTLLQLRGHPGWPYLIRAMEEMAALQAQPLLAGLLEHEKYLYQAGVLEAFRQILAFPDILANHRSNQHDRTPDSRPLDPYLNTVWYDLARRAGLNPGSPRT